MVYPPSTPPSQKKKTVAPETPRRHSGARRWKLCPADDFSKKSVVGEEIAFTEHSVIWIGTDEKNDLVLEYPFVSRFHVAIVPQEDGEGSKHCLIDQGSCNGTHVNLRKIEPHTPVPLRNGDVIALAGRVGEPVGVAFAYEVEDEGKDEVEDEAEKEERARRAFEEHLQKTFSKARYCNGELKRKGIMDFLEKKRRRT